MLTLLILLSFIFAFLALLSTQSNSDIGIFFLCAFVIISVYISIAGYICVPKTISVESVEILTFDDDATQYIKHGDKLININKVLKTVVPPGSRILIKEMSNKSMGLDFGNSCEYEIVK